METQNVSKKPLLVIDTNRFITQKEYCDQKGLSPQNLQNMITRNQIKFMHVKEFGITLIDTQADNKETFEVDLPKGLFTKAQFGEHFAKFALETLVENREFKAALLEQETLISSQASVISKQGEVITHIQNSCENFANEIAELTTSNSDFRKDCEEMKKELEEKDSLITKQSEVITQVEKTCYDLDVKRHTLESKVSDLEFELNNAKNYGEATNNELVKLKEKYEELQSNYKLLDESNVSQKVTLQSLAEKCNILVEKNEYLDRQNRDLQAQLTNGMLAKLIELNNEKQVKSLKSHD